VLFTLCLSTEFPGAESGMASPYPFRLQQPNGVMSPELMLHGGPQFHYMTDMNGFTVLQNENRTVVYAMMNETDGSLMPSEMMVGCDNPQRYGLQKHLIPKGQGNRRLCRGDCDDFADPTAATGLKGRSEFTNRNRRLTLPPMLKNLVILIRFSDHKEQGRILPTPSDVDVLLNQVGSSPLAPTGSVHDVFTTNSYGKFSLESEVYGWVDLSKTEAYYADGVSGFGTSRYVETLHEALDAVTNLPGFSFHDFDADGNNVLDMVTLIHSGYAAEIPGTDEYGAPMEDRIWSHRMQLSSSDYWTAPGVTVNQYSTSPALWHLSGSSIGRIGVIAHEIGHCLDLPDLYGTLSGNGVGSYDLMSNHWGFGPYKLRQLYPPIMSPWSKIKAGWLEPTQIVESGTYNAEASALHETVYRIDLGDHGVEYLLIENRQPVSYDIFLPQGGLAIWHIDETAADFEGFPGQEGWPRNGKHYKIAILQADGRYDLEQGPWQGDAGDLFHQDGVGSLDPSVSLSDGPFPNSDAYQYGFLHSTGISIYDISKSDSTMTFSVAFETSSPTSMPTSLIREISTTFAGGNGAAGNMFDVESHTSITLHAMELHVKAIGTVLIEVWTKPGSHVSFEKDPGAWSRLLTTEMESEGRGMRSFLDIGSLTMSAGEKKAFYVTALGGGTLRYTNGDGVGSVAASNEDLTVYEGVGKPVPFGYTFNNRIWNGSILYSLKIEIPAPFPTGLPTPVLPSEPQKLTTTFDGGTRQAGNMFDVLTFEDISITGFDIHIIDEIEVQVDVFTKEGSHVGFENDCEEWSMVASISVMGAGNGKPTYLTFESSGPLVLPRDHAQAFYITLRHGKNMRYTPGIGSGALVAVDDNIAIFEGVGKSYLCGATFFDRIWNGAIYYELAD
jgi:M6 family metalloprotease-like protein